MREKQYIAIDLKSFYASVECVDRGLDPLAVNLVVADESRTENTICLAVSPSLKAYGIGGRSRLFEVVRKVKEQNAERLAKAPGHQFLGSSIYDAELKKNPSLSVSYLVAPPRMARYMEVSAQIYAIYLRHVAPEDIFAYSIDEVFIDATPYLSLYGQSARALAVTMIRQVLADTGITATCGIGTNLYLAKIAMDILAKHAQADEDGVRLAELNEYTYRAKLWDHKPLTDFWRIGNATAKKLSRYSITTMGDIAQLSVSNQEWLYRMFGVDAEILIDHAWGVESCTLPLVKAYRPGVKSVSEGQVLKEPYPAKKARIIVSEMADSLMYRLLKEELVTDQLTMDIGYDRENCDRGIYMAVPKIDHYGRAVPPPAHGSTNLDCPTNLGSKLRDAALRMFDRIADKRFTIRRITVTANRVMPDNGVRQLNFFTDAKKAEEEKSLQKALLNIREKYGKNAVLRGTDFEEGATARERNNQIGGHQA